MPTAFLTALARTPLPTRITDPARIGQLRRLVATRQVQATFVVVGGIIEAHVIDITPLGRKVVQCLDTGIKHARANPQPLVAQATPAQRRELDS